MGGRTDTCGELSSLIQSERNSGISGVQGQREVSSFARSVLGRWEIIPMQKLVHFLHSSFSAFYLFIPFGGAVELT